MPTDALSDAVCDINHLRPSAANNSFLRGKSHSKALACHHKDGGTGSALVLQTRLCYPVLPNVQFDSAELPYVKIENRRVCKT